MSCRTVRLPFRPYSSGSSAWKGSLASLLLSATSHDASDAFKKIISLANAVVARTNAARLKLIRDTLVGKAGIWWSDLRHWLVVARGIRRPKGRSQL